MSGLIEFVRARVAEDERIAKDAAKKRSSPWLVNGVAIRAIVYSESGGQGHTVADTYGVLADHIARHDPERVLRQAAAVRAVLAHYDYCRENYCPGNEHLDPDHMLDEVIAPLAAIWSDHRDYESAVAS